MSYDPHQQHPRQPSQSGPYPPTPYYGPPQQFQPPHGIPPPATFMPAPQKPPKRWSPGLIVTVTVAAVVSLCLFVGAIANFADDGDSRVTAAKPAAPEAVEPADQENDAQQEEPAADAAKTFNLPLGTTMTVTGDDGSVLEGTLRSVKAYTKGCSGFAPKPDNGMYVVVDVIVVQKEGTGTVNPLDFTFVADDGTSANALSGSFSSCDEPSLHSADLRAGQKRAGKIAFDANSKAGTVEWAPGGLGADTVGSWKTN